MSILSLLDDRSKTYRIVCCLFGKHRDQGGATAWGPPYDTTEEAEKGVWERYPGLGKADATPQLTIGFDFGQHAWDHRWDVVAVYEIETGYVEHLYFLDPVTP